MTRYGHFIDAWIKYTFLRYPTFVGYCFTRKYTKTFIFTTQTYKCLICSMNIKDSVSMNLLHRTTFYQDHPMTLSLKNSILRTSCKTGGHKAENIEQYNDFLSQPQLLPSGLEDRNIDMS